VRITLEELELRPVTASEQYAPGAIDYHGAEFRQTGPLRIEAIAKLEGQEIGIRGHLETQLESSCDRCLGPVKILVSRDFDLVYRPMSSIAKAEEEIEIPADEMEVGFYSGDGIELVDVATEQVILSVPMKVVCRAECRGLCPVCGVNRNLQQCQCSPPEHDSPFALLKDE
jgi:uncharacterized protein